MVYGMECGHREYFLMILCILLAAGSAGCLSGVFGPAPSYNQPATVTPSPALTASPSIEGLALQPADLPSDYILRDRSVVAYGGISQLDRDLDWQQGYQISYYRLDKKHDDMTDVSQLINTYGAGNINAVFRIKQADMVPAGYNASGYQIPFPIVGDQSVAWKETGSSSEGNTTTYTVIFVKNNVFEQIRMEGTTTDYEVLKSLAQAAAGRIH
jgi:hypothetical protein